MSNQPGNVQKMDYISTAEIAAGEKLQPGDLQKVNFPNGIPADVVDPGFDQYLALLTQAGAGAPTATIIKNDLSAAIVWTRSGAGVYVGTLAGAFTTDEKTVLVMIPDGTATNGFITAVVTSADVITVSSFSDADLTTPADATGTFHIDVKVYP